MSHKLWVITYEILSFIRVSWVQHQCPYLASRLQNILFQYFILTNLVKCNFMKRSRLPRAYITLFVLYKDYDRVFGSIWITGQHQLTLSPRDRSCDESCDKSGDLVKGDCGLYCMASCFNQFLFNEIDKFSVKSIWLYKNRLPVRDNHYWAVCPDLRFGSELGFSRQTVRFVRGWPHRKIENILDDVCPCTCIYCEFILNHDKGRHHWNYFLWTIGML